MKLAVVYALLLVPQFRGAGIYSAAYRAAAGAVFARMGNGAVVQFRKAPPEFRDRDVQITMTHSRTGARGTMELTTRTLDYLPAAFTLALIVATPVPWGRKVWSLLFGTALIGAFAMFRLYVQLVLDLSEPGPLSAFSPGPVLLETLRTIKLLFGRSVVTVFTIPAFVWALTTIRLSDLAGLLPAAPGSAKPPRLSPAVRK